MSRGTGQALARRFDTWLVAKDAAAKDLKLAYQAVISTGDAATAIAAAARIGQVAQHASEAMSTADVRAFIGPYRKRPSATATRSATRSNASTR